MTLPEQYRKPLEKFSSEEILQGLLDLFRELDAKSGMTNHQYSSITVIKFNSYLIDDALPLHQMLAKHGQPRDFYHLSGLAYSLTKARGEDFIPSFFNTLFKDGRVARDQGEYTKSFAHDVSRLAYGMILASIRELGADYIKARAESLSHEEEVDHLAKWLIANWPGCENFTLSDQNVPAILRTSSQKKISREPRTQTKENAASPKEPFKISWPVIAAMIFLIGSFAYWRKKRLGCS